MNFLAHFQLAWPDEHLLLGGLEGDYYKGPLARDLHPGIAAGIRLHRSIDAFTDNHPLVAALREEFPRGLRRYAGIVIDLAFDHFLSLHWGRFSDVPLAQFNARVYDLLQRERELLSTPARNMANRLAQHDVLGIYGEWRSVGASAARIGDRLRRGNPLRDAGEDIDQLRPAIAGTFTEFYPLLAEFCAAQTGNRD